MAPKRKRGVLTMKNEVEIVSKLKNCEIGTKLASEYGVGTI